MAFGKRRVPPKKPGDTSAPIKPALPAEAQRTQAERMAAWLEVMDGILRDASVIAAAVHDEGAITVRGLDTEVHPDTTPISVKGIDEHFAVYDGARPVHPIYGYVLPTTPTQIDQSAHLHLHKLIARVMELNVYCQRAEREGAIAVALQAPKFPPLLDRILVASAFFAAYFENLALTQPMLLAGAAANASTIDWKRLTQSHERRRLMAVDRMLAPHTFDDLLPFRKWPSIGIETTVAPHAGQRFINGIYFPVSLSPAPMGPGLRATAALSAA